MLAEFITYWSISSVLGFCVLFWIWWTIYRGNISFLYIRLCSQHYYNLLKLAVISSIHSKLPSTFRKDHHMKLVMKSLNSQDPLNFQMYLLAIKERVCIYLRCKSFQTAKRGEVCRIPGCSVSPAAPGTPTPVRLPQAPPETFKQFLLYVYTGKVLRQTSKFLKIWSVYL